MCGAGDARHRLAAARGQVVGRVEDQKRLSILHDIWLRTACKRRDGRRRRMIRMASRGVPSADVKANVREVTLMMARPPTTIDYIKDSNLRCADNQGGG